MVRTMTPMASLARATHGELLTLASAGDQAAWNELVDRFSQMVWSIARSFRLDDATAKDVSQTVWLRLVENMHRIDDPERLPGWLATTCRREALRVKGCGSDQFPPTSNTTSPTNHRHWKRCWSKMRRPERS